MNLEELPTAYDAQAAEARWYDEWERRGYFGAAAGSERPPYCIVLPPPNVTGALHIGHAFQQLLQDIVIFTFFADATVGSVASLVDRENLVRKIHFPRMVVPLSVVLTAYFNFLLNLLVVIVFALASGVEPRISWLELPLLLVFLGLFVIGIAMLLSSLYVRFRDVQPIWDVVAQALFYASPVIYVIEKIPQPAWKHIVMCNPDRLDLVTITPDCSTSPW